MHLVAIVAVVVALATGWWLFQRTQHSPPPEEVNHQPDDGPTSSPPQSNSGGPEWCIVANLLPYPYNPGPHEHHRSQKIFPAGAKLHVIGGFAGMGHEVVTVVGTNHHGRIVTANIAARYLGGWRVALIYRPAVLRAIREAPNDVRFPAHRWNEAQLEFDAPEYAELLRQRAEGFQRWLHGDRQ
ncbi:hypothetical protein [Nocardia heshunensis]